MLARVPIISAYDPRIESMLAYASPSHKIATMIIGLVVGCKKLSNKTNLVVSLSKQPLLFIYVLLIILQTYPTTPTKYL